MKKTSLILSIAGLFALTQGHAQNSFPATGRAGIYTTAPAASLQVKGGARIGTLSNYTNIDSATGNLSFAGTSQYLVAGNKYAFAFAGNPNYGLYFNQTNLRYEFRDGTAAAVSYIGANDGSGYFKGNLGAGTTTPVAKLDVNGTVFLRGVNSNTLTGSLKSGVELFVGRNSLGALPPGLTQGDIALNYGGPEGGFRHFIVSRHNALTNSNTNAIDFYINNSTLGLASSQPETGNVLGLSITATGVGIGTKLPTAKLEVSGADIKVNDLTIGRGPGGSNFNVAVGINALAANNVNADFNTAVGGSSLKSNTIGEYNTAVGNNSLVLNTTGTRNTGIGDLALQTSNGEGNTAVGHATLASLSGTTLGSFNSAIGTYADITTNNVSNTTVIGANAIATASNQVRIGDAAVTSIGGQVGWTTLSDGRVKKNIKTNVPGLAFINKLQPVTYNLDENAYDKIIQRAKPTGNNGEGIVLPAEILAARQAKEKINYTGFIAQDVEKAAKELDYDFSGVDAPKNDKDLYGLRYSDFVIPLVKAVQELSTQNKELKERLDKIEQMLAAGSTMQSANDNAITGVTLHDAKLAQNKPNPFNQNTIISFYIPQHTGNAFVQVVGTDGKMIKSIPVVTSGSGQVTINAGLLSSGTYQYSLVIDGKIVDSKKMMLIK